MIALSIENRMHYFNLQNRRIQLNIRIIYQ